MQALKDGAINSFGHLIDLGFVSEAEHVQARREPVKKPLVPQALIPFTFQEKIRSMAAPLMLLSFLYLKIDRKYYLVYFAADCDKFAG